MHIYKPLTKPTAVSHSLTCHFTGEDNLITVKGNSLLQIFRITTITSETIVASTEETDTQEVAETGEDTFIGTEIGLQTADERSLSKLILICEVPLDGYVTDIGSIRSSLYHSKDILILSFKHAKMVLLIWDEEKFCTTPISVHYYEKDLFDSHFADPNYVSRFKTEPLNTCLCLMYQKDQMAFLPFYRDESLDDGNTKGSNPEDQPIYSPSFALPVSRLDESISHVIDFAFLYEYREPTIAIVFQPVRTWTGTIPLHKDTVRYLVMSLDLQQRSSTTITSVSKLPFDINQILPLPSPLGGSLLIGANHVLHIDTSGKVKGVAVNKFSELITEQSLDDHQDDLDLRLEGCKAVYLKECDQVLMTLQDGRLFTVKFLIEGRKIFKLTVSPLPILENGAADGLIPHPSSMSSMKNRTVFIGSSTSDAHLLGWTIKGERSLPSDGKVAVANEHGDETDQDKDNGDDLDDIYGEYERDDTKVDSDVSGISKKDLKFYIHDSITNYGPINSLCIGSGESHTRKEVYNIVTATGSGHSGGISIFQNSIDPVLISSLNLGSYDRIWTFASNSLAGETMGSEEASIFDTHVITSSTTGTKLYKIGDKFEKVTDTDFKLDSSTREIFVANNGTLIIQILEKKIVLYTSDFTVLETVKLETIPIDAKFQDPYILLLTKKSYTIHEVRYIGGKANLKQVKIPAPLNKSFATISLGTTSLLNQTKPQKKGVKRKRGKDNRETDELISTSPVPVGTMVTKQGDLEVSNFLFFFLKFFF